MESEYKKPIVLHRITLKDRYRHYAECGLAMAGADKVCVGMFLDMKDLKEMLSDAWSDGTWAVPVPGSIPLNRTFEQYWRERHGK